MLQNNQFQDPNTVRLLWTSGWDSTFRLLQAVIEEERTVLPIYIISDRASTPVEIKTMNEIKKLTFQLFPKTVGRILDTVFYYIHDIKKYPEVTQKHRTLITQSHLGSQYEWLSRFAKQHGITDLELGIVKGGIVTTLLKDVVVRTEDEHGEYYSLDPAIEDSNLLSLFKPFRFPIFDWTKLTMREHAVKTGTFEIMKITWFCHSPKNGEPCGICNPCTSSIKQGMEFRFPKTALMRYRMEPVNSKVRKVKGVARKLYHSLQKRFLFIVG